jgi:hypothetical protein
VGASEHGNKVSGTAEDDISLLDERLLAFQEGLCSMVLARPVMK